MTRYLIYGALGLLTALAFAFGMVLQYGLDPFDSRMTLYWVIIVIVGLYVTLRVSMILEKRRRKHEARGTDTRPSGATRRVKSLPSSLDARMEARRERVRRAKEQVENDERTDN